jgi:hypothetical protein
MSTNAGARNSVANLKARREMLIARAGLERAAIREATQDMQIASERIARIALVGITLVRRYWLPVGVLLAGGLFKRARPFLKVARTGLAVWQTVRLLRR